MKVFISWSKDESRQIAEALRDWLSMMFESVDPYMSARDNEAGARWGAVIASELDASSFGILCLTPANLTSPWLLFEAGALGKSFGGSHVVPLLWNLSNADVTSPLNQFQMESANKAGIFEVIKAINAALEKPRRDDVLAATFEGLWPDLEAKLDQIKLPTAAQSAATHRKDRELLEEIVEIVRGIRREAPGTRILGDPRHLPPSSERYLVRRNDLALHQLTDFLGRLASALPPGYQSLLESKADGLLVAIKPPRRASFTEAQKVAKSWAREGADFGIRVVLADLDEPSGLADEAGE